MGMWLPTQSSHSGAISTLDCPTSFPPIDSGARSFANINFTPEQVRIDLIGPPFSRLAPRGRTYRNDTVSYGEVDTRGRRVDVTIIIQKPETRRQVTSTLSRFIPNK